MSLFGRIKKIGKKIGGVVKGIGKPLKKVFKTADSFLGGGVGKLAGKVVTGFMQKGAAKTNREFQRDMSNTAFARRKADMERAGVNPLYDLSGASSPGGATAQVPDFGDVADTAITAKTTKAQRALMSSQLALANANTSNVEASTKNTEAGTARVKQQMEIDRGKAASGTAFGTAGETIWETLLKVLGVPVKGGNSAKDEKDRQGVGVDGKLLIHKGNSKQ